MSISYYQFYLFDVECDVIFSFSHTDYALAYSLTDYQDLRWIMLSYDIWCSYHVNLKKCFSKYFLGWPI